MSDNVQLDRLLATFGERAGMGSLALGTEGTLALASDGGLTLHVAAGDAPDEALLYAGLPVARTDQEKPVWRRLLEANATLPAGTAFALHPQVGTAMLLRRLTLSGLDDAGFERAVEEFLSLAEAWHADLAAVASADDGPAPAAGRDLPPFFGIRA